MKIAVTHPTNWPYVRRGAERFANELASYLAREGHDVTLICGKPGASEVVQCDGYTTQYHRRYWTPTLAHAGVTESHTFFFNLLPALVRGRYDIVHCCAFIDAVAAVAASRFTPLKCVYMFATVPPP